MVFSLMQAATCLRLELSIVFLLSIMCFRFSRCTSQDQSTMSYQKSINVRCAVIFITIRYTNVYRQSVTQLAKKLIRHKTIDWST
jgi:hypothetical protein